MDFFTSQQNFFDAILNLDFSIPPEIFYVLHSLTNFVGYIMPLYLYMPIITLILSYWFLMISVTAGKACINMFGSLSSFISSAYKKLP